MIKHDVKKYISVIYIFLSFVAIDIWLRFFTKELGLYDITELPPNIFTICWSLLITDVLLMIPNRTVGRIVYGILYYVLAIYVIVQYVYFQIFEKFLFFSDFLFAGEGANYIGYVLAVLTKPVILKMVCLLLIGVIGIMSFPNIKNVSKKRVICHVSTWVCAIIGIIVAPNLYSTISSEKDSYIDVAFEYDRFVNSAYDMPLSGVYQYMAKDAGKHISKQLFYESTEQEALEEIDEYFSTKNSTFRNEMTGVFEGKNVIIVMMESIDDWLITEEDMPTVYYMMNHGINFTNLYTPNYSSGYTINTEFAFNTSMYPLTDENYVYTLVNNNFNNSIANVFKSNGYSVNSFHYNTADFYNRGVLHESLGYDKYHSFYQYSDNGGLIIDDRFVYLNNELYKDLTNAESSADTPFMSFVISYSAHLPYVYGYSQYAQEYFGDDFSEEAIIRGKAHVTDDMFKGLLTRLEEDGILEDTVIVGYADHYAYGFNDEELLKELSVQAGSGILEKTPAFIYCSDMDESIIVDKVSQITDLGPTIENLFGLTFSKEIMGNDVFDDAYEGYAIFMNNTWITNDVYMKDGVIIYNNGMTEQEIENMNEFVKKTYLVNDYLLKYNYFDNED